MIINLESFLTKSKRGEKIVFEGNGYNYKEKTENFILWRCCKRGYPGILRTNERYELLSLKQHIHFIDLTKTKSFEVLGESKERALTTSETPRNIVSRVLTKNNCHDSMNYKTSYLMEQINKTRRNNAEINKINNKKANLFVNNRNVKVLLYDSGEKDENRMMIFSTESDIIHLKNSDIWIIDGTFKVVLVNFEQMVIIQARIGGILSR
jgi:hypothetical protein